MAEHADPIDDATREAEEHEARAAHEADRMPTEEEEEVADTLKPSPQTVASEEEMTRLGAEVKGEGEI